MFGRTASGGKGRLGAEVTNFVTLCARQRERFSRDMGERVTGGCFNLHNTEWLDGARLPALCPGDTPPVMSPPAGSRTRCPSCRCHITLGRASQIACRKLGFGKARNV